MSKSISPFRKRQTKEFTKRLQRLILPGLIIVIIASVIYTIGLFRWDEPLMQRSMIFLFIGGALMYLGIWIYEKFLKK